MSRTFRKKNQDWDLRDYDWGYNADGHFTKFFTPKGTPEYKKLKADFHRDRDQWGGGVPSWYINMYHERGLRQKTKTVIHRWLKDPSPDGCIAPEFKRDAGSWYW